MLGFHTGKAVASAAEKITVEIKAPQTQMLILQ